LWDPRSRPGQNKGTFSFLTGKDECPLILLLILLHGAGVLEAVEDDDGNTYRAVYTVRLAGVEHVLHAFQKKSKRGAKTPAEEIEKVKTRFKEAEKHHAEWAQKQKGEDQRHH
jgi:hypothetical protein